MDYIILFSLFISVDPFYSESNMTYLKKVVEDIESGKAVLVEHESIED